MATENFVLAGKHIRLEPLAHRHVDGLGGGGAGTRSLPVESRPARQGRGHPLRRHRPGLARRRDRGALRDRPSSDDGIVIGSTRFFDLERWVWPEGHPQHGRSLPDACEIGYTWLTRSAIRTAANTEAKLLMLTYAFETWQVLRVCLHTDVRNQRSRAAIERIGGKFEGILRAHRMAADFIPATRRAIRSSRRSGQR